MTQKTYEEDVVFTTGPAKLGGTGAGGKITSTPLHTHTVFLNGVVRGHFLGIKIEINV